MTETRSTLQRSAQLTSVIAGLVVVGVPLLTWLGSNDLTRTFMGVLIGTVVGFALGGLGPGVAAAITGLIGPPARGLLVAAALAMLVWAVLGLSFGANSIAKTISLSAAAVMLVCWIPLSRLSGR